MWPALPTTGALRHHDILATSRLGPSTSVNFPPANARPAQHPSIMDNAAQDDETWELSADGCHVWLTRDHLDAVQTMNRVRSPKAGAIVLFAGTTRDSFAGKPVKELTYTAYNKRALRTMLAICVALRDKHGLKGVAMAHRLGTVPIAEESILIAVSAPHRQAAWRAGEEALEECKARVEVWKREEFHGEEGVWRANRDGARGDRITES
ncbi:molybdenum cofactor synthesis protein 2B [Purpureocillium lavendulum]|uniref:Molybdopterin synthase catalytic subunit n=1 Tax=Purpureocillium lavendulum TaxID=1247861 RepID=A0AB34G9H2_9HYPO|nr:molybdenum cofactor synthesis protein 2B [Purpureocillium lavendulum]